MRNLWMLVLLLASPAQTEVLSVANDGFVSQHELVLKATPAEAYTALTDQLHNWWDAAHSYGGQASAFTLDARAGGCFCEALPNGGSVEHMRVVNAQPGKSLTLQGGLGPLQSMAVSGSMLFRLQPHEQGTLLTYRYVVGGYHPGGLQSLAGPVDQVQLGQLQRLARFIASGQYLNQN